MLMDYVMVALMSLHGLNDPSKVQVMKEYPTMEACKKELKTTEKPKRATGLVCLKIDRD